MFKSVMLTERGVQIILPLSAATPPAPAFSLAESRGISEMLSTHPESRLSISLICRRVAEERRRVYVLKGGDNDVYL